MTVVNFVACGIIAFLLLAAVYLLWMRPTKFLLSDTIAKQSNVPKGAFERPQKDYNAIDTPAFSLKFLPLSVQLPDLKRYLIYYGKNGRPDAKEERPMLYFSFSANKPPLPVSPDERLYLLYDKPQKQYIFSPGNKETPLWMQVYPQGSQALIKVGMKNENGIIISEPEANAEFTLPEKEYVRSPSTAWELDKWRVDGTLLARQKAKWFGTDRFLEKHGGKEYKDFENKQRIDFGENEDSYSVYIGFNDCVAWKDGRWQTLQPSKESLNYPLMCLKKVDDRIMTLELWDVDGRGKIILNLLRTNEAWMPQNLQQGFKFLGSRTRSQFVFEIDHERVFLRPHDWLVLTDIGWKKLVTPEEIDAYVDRKIVGPLFVFDGIERKDERPVIMGTLFSASRSETAPIEIQVQLNSGAPPSIEKEQKQKDPNAPQTNRLPAERGNGGQTKQPSNRK